MVNDKFPSAKIIAHSQAPNGEELITMEVELHRFILPEFNTHRSFSRNFQSSRAVPIGQMIEQVKNDPAIPVHWGKNQKGMIAENEVAEIQTCINEWTRASEAACVYASHLNTERVHKQVVNRLLEPFMKTKGVVTATRTAFEAFFKLRCHKDAQPEIKLLAERMQKAIAGSTPNKLRYGEYHLPYVHIVQDYYTPDYAEYYSDVDHTVRYSVDEAIKVSCSCNAQVSYRRLDESLDKALEVYGMLNLPVDGVYPEDPPHYSPTEHIVKIVDAGDVLDGGYHGTDIGGNFNSRTFWQYRKALEAGAEQEFVGE